MRPVRTFTVKPALPPAIERLRQLAANLRWAWDHEAIALFRRLDRDLWESTGHNPVRMLGTIDQDRLEQAAQDEGFLTHMSRVAGDLDSYLEGRGAWFARQHPQEPGTLAAYFSAEFGLTECLSIFAGGLGILSGDHLKSASDLGLPLVGVGLLYQQGYFRQYLNEAGWQQQAYEDNDFYNLPVALVRDAKGAAIRIPLPELGRPAWAQVWRLDVGRVPLYLLDTNIPENEPAERDVTDQLYGGDLDMRIRQEIVLGLGGYRALEALGIEPRIYHMNEGHSAFLALERMRRLVERDRLPFAAAREVASSGLVFTTHTPIPAGHDFFPPALVEKHFGDHARAMGVSMREVLALGRRDPADDAEPFCMTTLALRLAAFSNAVSRLHGQTTRRMWRALWPQVPDDEIPIRYVTNGVHFRSWISEEMNQLYDRYLGPRWREEPADRMSWQAAARIPAEELWRTHERRREKLVAFARRRLRAQLEQRGAPRHEIEAADGVLHPEALTIGFARRFASYKRATLLLHDRERLGRLLTDATRPVQVVFAGKAHPRDDAGKKLIQEIVQFARRSEFRTRVVFLEDSDMALERYLVQGADVWLNTPRRPNEASGTSGMKAAANAVLNLSTLDGWWDEAWSGAGKEVAPFGWAIGRGETYEDEAAQDAVEANALYNLIEREIVPEFYDRGPDGTPMRWIERMRSALGNLCHAYNTHRMVREYAESFYLQAAHRASMLAERDWESARDLAAWRARLQAAWAAVTVEVLDSMPPPELQVGEAIAARARVRLGALTPDDVRVELYMGRIDAGDEIVSGRPVPMRPAGQESPGVHLFEAEAVRCRESGRIGFTVRVVPYHAALPARFGPGLVAWAPPPGKPVDVPRRQA